MKLTTEQIRQLIKEELQKIHEEDEESLLPKLISTMKIPGRWRQSMELRSALDKQEQEEFMKAAAKYTMDKIGELRNDLDASHRRRSTGQYFKFSDITHDAIYQIQIQTYMYESFFQDTFDESFVYLHKGTGLFDIDLHIKPSSDFMDYINPSHERYQQEGLDLEEVIDMLRNIYTQGGTIQ
jgi:hypothetical protein